MLKRIKKLFKHLFVPHKGNAYRPHAFRHKALSLYSIALLVSQFMMGTTMYSGPVIMNGDAKAIAKNIIILSNKERDNINLNELYENETLDKAAELKLKDMFNKNYWDHSGPNGETAWDFVSNTGYQYLLAGENLARGFSNSDETVKAWMNSPTHKENILNNRFQEIGVAVGSGKINGNLTTVVVQIFGEPKTAFASAKDSETQNVLGSQKLIPEFSLDNTTFPSKAPYFALWFFIFGLIIVDGIMIRRLGLNASRSHLFNFRVALLLSAVVLGLMSFGFAGIA